MNHRIGWAGVSVLVLASFVAMLGAPPPHPPRQEEQQLPDKPMCPLSEEQTTKAIKAFSELSPIFREPRCKNCHGAVLPISNPATHGADPPVEEGVDCSSCHNELPGWDLAPGQMSFVNRTSIFAYTSKSDQELCEQMRDFNNAVGNNSFMGHMINDNGGIPFIEAAFIGKKGMSDPDSVDPPSNRGWNHPRMVRFSQDWVDAMGGRFHGDQSCGCKSQHYALRLDYHSFINLAFGVVNGQFEQQTVGQNADSVDIPLEGKAPNYFEGDGVLTLKGHGQMNTPVGLCTSQSENSFQIHATATMDEGDEDSRGSKNKLHVKLECSQMHFSSTGSCPRASGGASDSGPCKDPVELTFDPADLEKPQGKVFPMPMPDSQATLTATIVQTD
jgi:hypothetical protein